jgi:hypothetical protein
MTITTVNLDAGADSPRLARAQILEVVQGFNDLGDASSAIKGAGMPAFNALLSYAAGSVGAKLRERVSVDDRGAVGDGVTDDYAAIAAAQASLVARGGGTLYFTPGKTYRIGTAITMASGITYEGTGRSTTDSNGSSMGARIVSNASAIFTNSGAITAGVCFHKLWLESEAGGGHIFDWTGSGLVAKIDIDGCCLFQRNAGKSVINGVATNGIFSIWLHDTEYYYTVGNTVPAIKLASTTVNSVVIENFWSICSSGATSGTYSIWIESTNASGAASNVVVRQGVFEVCGGGAINMLSCRQSAIEDCGVYDLLVTPNNPLFRIAKGPIGPASNDCAVRRLLSTVGTSSKPDLQLDISVGGQSGFVVEHCRLSWYDGVSANGPGALHIANSISNYLNAAFMEFGAASTVDLRWVSQSASGRTYAIWNGVPGDGEGYLNIYQSGVYVGAISPTGLFEWGGSRSAPAFYVTQGGVLNTKGKIFPGTPAGVDQGSCGLYAGSGVPSNSNGNDGDFYFRSDTPGTASQRIYVKSAGSWVGIV